MGKSTDDNGQNTTRGMFQEQVCSLAKEKWNAEGTVKEKWTAIKTALTETAQSVLGKKGRYNPDWYKENNVMLELLFKCRNQLYARWLSTGKASNSCSTKHVVMLGRQ